MQKIVKEFNSTEEFYNQEYEADLYAMLILVNMKVDPNYFIQLLERLFPHNLKRISIAKSNVDKLYNIYKVIHNT